MVRTVGPLWRKPNGPWRFDCGGLLSHMSVIRNSGKGFLETIWVNESKEDKNRQKVNVCLLIT